jgi:hypothetical protein
VVATGLPVFFVSKLRNADSIKEGRFEIARKKRRRLENRRSLLNEMRLLHRRTDGDRKI